MSDPRTAYLPIADHGVIGNLRTAALVGLDGTIDWWCAPHLGSPSVFASLLDARRGGRFRVAPRRALGRAQRYVEGTNVLQTVFETEGGRVTMTDFMPLAGDLLGKAEGSATTPEILRILEVDGGEGCPIEVEWSPRPDYARATPRLYRSETGFVAESAAGRLALTGLPAGSDAAIEPDESGPTAHAGFRLRPGHRAVLSCCWDADGPGFEAGRGERLLAETIDCWTAWLRQNRAPEREWAGEWAGQVTRSQLVLKLLTQAGHGSLAAAATTSLPETIGGVRNWDYRFSWIRDASLVAQGLMEVGHADEMQAFLEWVRFVAEDGRGPAGRLQVVYGLHGERETPEESLDHLEGYRGSRPVRIGNEAGEQKQHDIFSDLLCAAHELSRERELTAPTWEFLGRVVDQSMDRWDEPDHGIWEMRTGPHPFVFSRVKLWASLSRSIRLAEDGRIRGDVARWRAVRARLRDQVLERGYDRDLGAFVMAYDRPTLDAANLQIPLVEFLAPDDPRVLGTIDRTLERLTANGLVYRYRTDDGLPGDEGAFGLCTFWLADALALAGRVDEAHATFDGIARRANHVGLYSEQIDPGTGAFLGNFPQAFSHIGFINSLLYLAHAEGRELPVSPLIGTPEHRRQAGLDA